ncbi:MAG: DUF4919 domain-containing protein [Rikenellaceae bacterium]
MVYRLFLTLGVLFSTLSSWGVSPPDMEALRDSISDASSRYYYPILMDRYVMNDSTLTLEDYHYLYYGYTEQINYMPLLDNSARSELESIMSGQSNPTVADYERAVALVRAILEIEPFNPRDINALAYLYAMTGYEDEAAILAHRLRMIVTTIKETGTGLSKDSPWWITYFSHAEDLVALEGLEQGQPIILSSSIEFVPVSKMPNRKDKGLYFNYSLIYEKDADYLENIDAPKRKMNWNPLEPATKFRY